MKFLLDMPISQRTREWLKQRGFDAIHARDVHLAKADDANILQYAAKEGRVLISMDLDFPAILAATGGREPGVIIFRLNRPIPDEIHQHLEHLFKTHPETDLIASVTMIEDFRIRIRKLPI